MVFSNNSSCFYATKLPAGNYSLVVQDKNGCEKSFEFEVKDLSVGISPSVNAQFKVYPNPVDTEFFVNGLNIQFIELYDLNGRKAYGSRTNAQNNRILRGNLSSGTYILRILTVDGRTEAMKIILK